MVSDIVAIFSGVSFEDLILLVQEHQYIIAVLTPLLMGEISIHVFGILNGSGDISLVPTMIAFVGIIVFDTIIYVGVKMLRRRGDALGLVRRVKLFVKFEVLFRKCEERYSKHPMVLLFAIKLMPMTKFTIIFFSLCQKVSVARFVLWDIIITSAWAVVIFLPGWFVGKEFLTQEAGRRVGSFVIYFLLLVVVMTFFGDWIDRLIMRVVAKVVGVLDNGKEK